MREGGTEGQGEGGGGLRVRVREGGTEGQGEGGGD